MDLVERRVSVAGRPVDLRMPADTEDLLTEEAFEREEFMPYWAELWPSTLALAEALAEHRPAQLHELGCGLGLPSLVAAQRGTDVVATDWAPDAIALLRDNARRNDVQVDARVWAWTSDPPPRRDLVVAADVLYERRNVTQLLSVLPALCDEAWIADPGRPALAEFLELAALGWTLSEVSHRGPATVRIHRLRAAA